MAEAGKLPVAPDDGPPKPTETLSQFVARVLNQLSLSAWLPSAALVLSVTFILQLGAVLDRHGKTAPTGPGDALDKVFESLARTSFGGALLLFAAVVVLTILTQAFAFESIRTLEGYWGTSRLAEAIGERRCRHFVTIGNGLRARYDSLTDKAWLSARTSIEATQAKDIDHNVVSETREWTPEMLTYLGAKLTKQSSDVTLDPAPRAAALAIPWERFAPADLLRRQVNLDKRIRDFPAEARTLPTRLGNVLRAHEDATGRTQVETMVLEVYDQIPPTLRNQHDEQRNRLDLYCSMTFVLGVVAILAGMRLGPSHWPYGAVVGGASLTLTWMAYRAAIASARVYGIVLRDIARRFPAPPV